MTFHHTCVHISFGSVWVAECPPFGKKLLTRLTICSLSILTIYNFRYYPFPGLEMGSDLLQFLVFAYFLLLRLNLLLDI